jgi:choline dehydrogenase
MTYVRAQKAQIDAWESIGNPGWNWETVFPYYKKAEHFDLPTPAQVAVGASYIPGYHDNTGPLHVGYQYELQNGTFYDAVRESWRKLGQPVNKDVNGGDVHGFDVWPKTCVRDLDLRADAAQAYYWPVAGRPNLRLVQGTATRMLWKDSGATASGVEYITSAGVIRTLTATREVILSAGSLRTPALLELSGVGNPK